MNPAKFYKELVCEIRQLEHYIAYIFQNRPQKRWHISMSDVELDLAILVSLDNGQYKYCDPIMFFAFFYQLAVL
jgi:hypothetical protein